MVAALLILGVGCDDSEVQEKVADILVYGAAVADVTCSMETPHPSPGQNGNLASMPGPVIYFNATLLLDGSCFVKLCIGSNSTGYGMISNPCRQTWAPKDPTGSKQCHALWDYDAMTSTSNYPFVQGVDGGHLYITAGNLVGQVVDNNMNQSGANCGSTQYPQSCSYPYPWFTQDITDAECSGRNIEAFGTTP
jgi:hypothetical protein